MIKIIPESVLLSGEMEKLGQTMENNFLFYRGVRIHFLLFLNSKEHLFTSNLILSLNETHLQNYKIKDKAAFRLHETKIVVIMREKRVK